MDTNLTSTPCNYTTWIPFSLSPPVKGIRIGIGAVVFVENILCLVVLYGAKPLQTALRYLLVNLTVSDMLSGPVFIYHSAVMDVDIFNNLSRECKIRYMLISFLTIVRSTTITVLNLERVLIFFRPFQYRKWITKKSLLAILIFIWIFSFLGVLTAYSVFSEKVFKGCHFSDMATAKTYLIMSGTRFSMLLIIAICQFLMLYAAKSHINAIARTLVGANQTLPTATMHLKATVATAVLVVPFTVCVLPLYGGSLYFGIHPQVQTSNKWKQFMSFALTLYIINGALNPIIYCWRLTTVRQSLKNLCCGSTNSVA